MQPVCKIYFADFGLAKSILFKSKQRGGTGGLINLAWESMLQEIYIKNFVLIDELRMEFYQGLNALTGETGAGKSIIIDALGLIVGGRINNDFIRDEKQKAIVEAVFSLENNPDAQAFLSEKNLLEEDDENSLIICREISPGRRNAARINGHNVPLSLLKELSPHLIDMHLQHDHLNILRPAMFIHYVDQFIEDGNITEKITAIFNNWQKKQQQLKLLNENEQARLQQVDLLNFQINEIEKVNLVPDEEEELLALRNRVKNANKLAEDAAHLVQILYSDEALNIFDLLGQTVDIIKKNQDDNFFASIQSNFEDMYYNVQDLAREIMTYRDSLDFEPGKLEEIEDRLHIINRLKAKYGKDIKEVLYYLSNARLELQKFNNVGQVREEYEQEIAQLEREYNSLASCLTAARKKAADKLQANVEKELIQLNMPDIKFLVAVNKREQPAFNGYDEVQFLFSPNAGEPMRPIEKIASGGEMSRFVLALKKALTQIYKVPTLIFDEIDVGVGGTALTAMALKISELAKSHQVILVTHAPQVASYADHHFLILKQTNNQRTATSVKRLEKSEVITELARMLAGQNYSEITLEHAKEMVEMAQKDTAS